MTHITTLLHNKIKNFFEYHRQDDGKNLKKPYKNLQKNSDHKINGRYSCILCFKIQYPIIPYKKGFKNFDEFR